MDDKTKPVVEAFERAKGMMKDAGYGIGDNVRAMVDPNLGFMGYTFPKAGKFTIVVSGAAVESGMLEGLLVHEMSHIYRMQSKHPSHDERIISKVTDTFAGRGLNRDYQQKILHDLVNHLEDLYADDVAFRVFGKSNIFPIEEGSRFFLSWLSPEPVVSGETMRDRWINMSLMLRNSFAMSNMARHGIPDIGNKAVRLNENFLSGLPANASNSFEYFYGMMMSLKENVTEKEFRNLLSDYLEKFVELVQADPTALD
jgi:hypothetical protein